VEQTIGRGARVIGSRRLTGGLTSLVTELTIDSSGNRTQYVLRSFEPSDEYADWRVRSIESEAATLPRLEGTGIPAPRLIGVMMDPEVGGPALLMTRLPGAVELMPADRGEWLQQMAATLARIHDLPAFGPPFEVWNDASRLAVPADAMHPDIWREAFGVAGQPPPSPSHTFIHRDYQHFNLLWLNGRLTGVVDWPGACVGPPDLDVGHCRLNLTLLFSADAADRFRDCYEIEAGRQVDPYWDMHALLSYSADWQYFLPMQIDGRAPFDAAGMTGRMEEALERALRRV
jgi:aminoglycoside phosphotransferase (APT) family kinase protein